MKAKYAWIAVIVVMLAVPVILYAGAIILVTVNPVSIEPDYEEKAANWDATRRQELMNKKLDWTLDLATQPAERAGQVRVRVELYDTFGKPIRNGEVVLEAFHVLRPDKVVSATLASNGEGVYSATVAMRPSGVWEFAFTAESDDRVYTETVRTSVLSQPGGRQGAP
jgi:nitrogen fixation protein FixH